MRLFPSHNASQLGQSTTVFQQAVSGLLVRLQAHLSHGVPHRSVHELLSADMLNFSSMLSTYEASTPKLHTSFVFEQCSLQVARRFCRHLAALGLQVMAQFSNLPTTSAPSSPN